jgi:hypothetical protein
VRYELICQLDLSRDLNKYYLYVYIVIANWHIERGKRRLGDQAHVEHSRGDIHGLALHTAR